MVRVANTAVVLCIVVACGNEPAPTDTSRVVGGGSGGEIHIDASPAPDASEAPDAPAEIPWRPPPGPENCRLYDPPVSGDIGEGRCVPPIAAPTSNCYNACWDEPGAPGPEQCSPSAAEELGERCCVPGRCGFDFGEGCGWTITLTDDPASACGEGSAALENVFEGIFEQVVITDTALVVGHFNSFTGNVTLVAKGDCSATEIYGNATVEQIGATSDAVYIETSDDSGRWVVDVVSLSGMVERVDLGALFGAQETYIGSMGMDGNSVYVVAAFELPNGEPSVGLVELPCCGASPRVIASGLAWQPFAGTWTQLLVSAGTLLSASEEPLGESSTRSLVTTVDLASGESSLIFDTLQSRVQPVPVAFEDGRLYLRAGSAIVSVRTDDCSVTPIVDRPSAEGITALTVNGGDLFWAENYEALFGSRLFVKRPGEAEAQIAQTSGHIAWIGVDATHVYWTVGRETGPFPRTLVRRLRP